MSHFGWIANEATAYRDLPEPLRALADSLWAVHTNDYAVPAEAADDVERERRAEFKSIRYQTAHPVVRVHPATGERGLYIGGFAQRIIGLTGGESRDVLRLLQSYVTRPENIVRWRWSPNQLVMFDNRLTQHYAIDNYNDLPLAWTESPLPARSRRVSTDGPATRSRETPLITLRRSRSAPVDG